MGRFVVTLFLLIAIGIVAVNGISFSWLDPRGVGTRIEGREVVLDADQLEARFSMVRMASTPVIASAPSVVP